MDQLTYAATVIQKANAKTLANKLKWDGHDRGHAHAEVLKTIRISIEFDQQDVESAIWKTMYVHHPFGTGVAMVSNPKHKDNERYQHLVASDETLRQIDEMFAHAVLAPRRVEFETAMKQLESL